MYNLLALSTGQPWFITVIVFIILFFPAVALGREYGFYGWLITALLFMIF